MHGYSPLLGLFCCLCLKNRKATFTRADRRQSAGFFLRGLLRQAFKRRENAVSTWVHPERGNEAPVHRALGRDDEERPFANAIFRAVDAIGACDLALRLEVGEERKVKIPVLGVGGMAPGAIDGDASEPGVVPGELLAKLIEESKFIPAHGAPVGGVEYQ